jgi:transcriptional regulator with XRE-family HTH domain
MPDAAKKPARRTRSARKGGAPAKRTAGARAAEPPAAAPDADSSAMQIARQMRSWSERMFDAAETAVGAAAAVRGALEAARKVGAGAAATRRLAGSSALGAAATAVGLMAPSAAQRAAWAKAGKALRDFREATGMTIREVGEAIDLNDPDLLEVAERGRIALPFEIILRLAAIIGRKDPIGFVLRLTRSSNPELWKTMEALGVGKLVLQSAREREFANIYRSSDAARSLGDKEFSDVLVFTKAAFEMALAFRGRKAARKE